MTPEEQVWFQALQAQLTAHENDIKQLREEIERLKGRLDEQRDTAALHRWEDNGGH